MVLACKAISMSFGVNDILTDVSFIIEEKEKVAIVGVNGAGKTTLFRIITGEYQPSGGELQLSGLSRVGYLPQIAELDSENTVYNELETVFDEIKSMEAEMRQIEKKMAQLTGDELAWAMEKYSRLTHMFEEQKGYEYQSRLRGVVKGLGFSQEEWEQPVSQLSGGQKTRLALGKLLLTEPEILLLDEPTNHLDIESIQWLENFLGGYNGSCIIISHDRYFLDKIVTKIIEIENKRSTIYNGNYSSYAKKKIVDREIMIRHYIDQQKEIKRQEEIIKTYRSYNTEKSIRKAESREKMLSKMDRMERPVSVPDKMRLFLTPKKESGNEVLFVEDLRMDFDMQNLFEHVSFAIRKGEKVALIGPNGIGKTTLFRIIMNEVDCTDGSVRLGVNVRIGYFDQEHQGLDENKTIFDEIYDSHPNLLAGQIRNVLAAFVFTGDDVFKSIASLSGGEKGRVELAKIMLGGANFLILDEPTNHLDMFSKEVLEEALRDFPGTALYISHDRYFINNTADKIIELSKDGCQIFLGNYDFYLEKKIEEKKNALLLESDEPVRSNIGAAKENIPTTTNDWARKKELKSSERKRKALLTKTETQIADAESELRELDALLEEEEINTDPVLLQEIYNKKVAVDEMLDKLYEIWDSCI